MEKWMYKTGFSSALLFLLLIKQSGRYIMTPYAKPNILVVLMFILGKIIEYSENHNLLKFKGIISEKNKEKIFENELEKNKIKVLKRQILG